MVKTESETDNMTYFLINLAYNYMTKNISFSEGQLNLNYEKTVTSLLKYVPILISTSWIKTYVHHLNRELIKIKYLKDVKRI